tara:strand:- start:273 stop:917 length:645 start_codon:yes stop_codon:yes gene_type:complete
MTKQCNREVDIAEVTISETENRRGVYLHLYVGDKPLFLRYFASHASVYVEGDTYEWSYTPSGNITTTHGINYCGITYERPRQFLYGDWKFWKAVHIGNIPTETCLGGKDDLTTMRDTRENVKASLGTRFTDNGYGLFTLNCMHFSAALLTHLGHKPSMGFIEGFNDEAHALPEGITFATFHLIGGCERFVRCCYSSLAGVLCRWPIFRTAQPCV